MSKPTTGKISRKSYRCEKCGKTFVVETNHWGKIYSTPCCGFGTTAVCSEPCPDTHGVPEEWTLVKLGDICEIKSGRM